MWTATVQARPVSVQDWISCPVPADYKYGISSVQHSKVLSFWTTVTYFVLFFSVSIFQIASTNCNCGVVGEQLRARLQYVESNFTQSVKSMRMEMDQIAKERDNLNLETIRLRRETSKKDKQLELCEQTSKNEFTRSLGSVYNVSRAFLQKIESLFPAHIAFQLTCPKQREHLEQIRSNCTNLSREVEDKLQRYMNSVGEQVAGIQAENNRLKAENWRFSEDYRWCSQNRTGMMEQHRQNLAKLQEKHDQNQERILKEKIKLAGENEVLENSVKFKAKEVEHLMEQIKQLNRTCMAKVRKTTQDWVISSASRLLWALLCS